MTKKLEPIQGEIPEIDEKTRVMKLRCVGKGDALWAQFEFLYPIVITSRKFLGHLANGAAQTVIIKAVKVNGQILAALPGHIDPGKLDIILEAKGSTSIELELTCRVEPQIAGEAGEAGAVEDAVAELTLQLNQEQADKRSVLPDPDPPPPPVDPRAHLGAVLPVAPMMTVEGPFPSDLPPEVAEQATASLREMLANPGMDDATRKSISAFMEHDGDPTETLRGLTSKRVPETV